MKTLGIDPGLDGAIAVLDGEGGLLEVFDMPTLADGPKGRRALPATIIKAGRGAPTLYRPSYCDMIIDFMRLGYSVTAFAGDIGVARATINLWAGANDEFMEALRTGKTACAWHWETMALKAGAVAREGGNAAIIMFALRNMAPDNWAGPCEAHQFG